MVMRSSEIMSNRPAGRPQLIRLEQATPGTRHFRILWRWLPLTALGGLTWANRCREGVRPPVAQQLLDELFLGNDPMLDFEYEDLVPDTSMTHMSAKDVDLVLSVAKPSFWLELGSFEGGSAIVASERILAHGLNTSVVAVDTFLGDVRVLWERPPEERRKLLRADGRITLFDRFRNHLRNANLHYCVLPLPATSVVALKLVDSLARRSRAPLPEVIYLDSAHEEGEVLLELGLAWKVLSPGGVLFGDDWLLPEEGETTSLLEGATHRDVLRFASLMEDELDDDWGSQVQSLRTLGRVRPGLFVSYNSFQWFMKKLPHVTSRSSKPFWPSVSNAGYVCWSAGFRKEDCCDEARFGPSGNAKCWDLVFTYERCCM
ncbi:unnamed protein product [Durusdinium trenchii]|uniref:Uncharacterized protein n=1 Tax=Durusdinium trenchii TaxID=1381693 RepID=A0ABP0N5A5_9DINO